jgi:hypothetical protein
MVLKKMKKELELLKSQRKKLQEQIALKESIEKERADIKKLTREAHPRAIVKLAKAFAKTVEKAHEFQKKIPKKRFTITDPYMMRLAKKKTGTR